MTSQDHDGALVFRLHRPRAASVAVAGDFNGWNPHNLHMEPMGDGWWTCRVQLTPGVYRFRYCVDGKWLPDYAAFGLIPGPDGWNSVVCVNETRRPTTTLRSPDALCPVTVDPCYETRSCGTARGHRSGVVDSRTERPLDEGTNSGKEPGRVLPWTPSPDARVPPEVFLG